LYVEAALQMNLAFLPELKYSAEDEEKYDESGGDRNFIDYS